jgi:hypothetical protein
MSQDRETHRIEAFSDGVFAIAITLLVLEMKVPSPETVSSQGMAIALIGLWPSYLAFIISFITILLFGLTTTGYLQQSEKLILCWFIGTDFCSFLSRLFHSLLDCSRNISYIRKRKLQRAYTLERFWRFRLYFTVCGCTRQSRESCWR